MAFCMFNWRLKIVSPPYQGGGRRKMSSESLASTALELEYATEHT